MAVALRGGLRAVVPRASRSALAVNAPRFGEREVEEGEALLEEHFPLQFHPDARMNSHIMKMARLYVREHGNELLEFMRQNEILSLEESENDNIEEMAFAEEQEIDFEEDLCSSQQLESDSQWSLRSILQWIWGKITSQGSGETCEDAPDEENEAEDHTTPQEPDALPPVLVHSIVAVSMLMIAAVVLARAK